MRIEHNEQDRLLLTKILSATIEAEEYMQEAIIARSFVTYAQAFPACCSGVFYLPHKYVTSITAVRYYDWDEVQQTLDPSNYELIPARPKPVLSPKPYDDGWPLAKNRPGSVEIVFVSGQATKPSEVAEPVREAVLLRAATRYEMPEEAGIGTVAWKAPNDMTFKALLNPFRGYGV